MTTWSQRWRARLRAFARVCARALMIVFILMMAVLPIPLAPFVARLVRRDRRDRNVATEVLRSEQDRK